MERCPLCGKKNPDSTNYCFSCGASLKNKPGLIRDTENPNLYTFSPGQRITVNKVTVGGSGIDLIYKFSTDRFIVPLAVIKIVIALIMMYETAVLYITGNTLYYVLVPISALLIINLVGWCLMYYGGCKKKRKLVSRGLLFLYSYYVIAAAYVLMVLAVALYFTVATGLIVVDYENSSQMRMQSAITLISVTVLVTFTVMCIAVCVKFFNYAGDIMNRNIVKKYRFTNFVPAIFLFKSIMVSMLGYMLILKISADSILKFINLDVLVSYYNFCMNNRFAIFGIFLLAVVSALSAVIIIRYIKTYNKMFLKAG